MSWSARVSARVVPDGSSQATARSLHELTGEASGAPAAGWQAPTGGIVTGTRTHTYTYDTEMNRGRTALAARDFRTAYRHFGRAHDIGHNVLARHLAAHRGLLATAWKQRRIDRAAKQLFLLTAAPLFNRNTHDRDSGVANGGGAKRWSRGT